MDIFFPPIFNLDSNTGRVSTALFIQLDIEYVSITPPIPTTANNINACALKMNIFSNSCIIISVYLPKGPNENNTDWLKHIKKDNNENYIITGDFNAHSPFWERDCQIITSNRLLENIIDSNLYLLNDGQSTRVPDNINHRSTAIDLSLISPELAPYCNWTPWCDTLNSDHFPIIITLDKAQKVNPDQTDNKIPKFKYKFADWNKFSINFFNINIEENTKNINSIDKLYSIFRDYIIDSALDAIPQIKAKANNLHKGNVWWNAECEIARKEKWASFKKYLKEPTQSNLLNSKKAKNKANRVIQEAKRKYWSDLCDENLHTNITMQEIWEKVKTMKNVSQLPKYQINLNNNQLPSQTEKAEAFADHFAKNSTLLGLKDNDRDYRTKTEKNTIRQGYFYT